MISVGDSTQSNTGNREFCELWHRRMTHLHHGALRILREITTGALKFSTERYDVCKGCVMGEVH